ncbi:hypothetical protein CEXT_494831 [Caerostris extrusa]|uniref:Uncharacterized protein n=1 Tax=Caerostris extrusa TaxID=172846 RepID=A0AAV4P0X8_CAEEX|nr:hypothetical protein CEXT_494831 [Caerostris extrusa]
MTEIFIYSIPPKTQPATLTAIGLPASLTSLGERVVCKSCRPSHTPLIAPGLCIDGQRRDWKLESGNMIYVLDRQLMGSERYSGTDRRDWVKSPGLCFSPWRQCTDGQRRDWKLESGNMIYVLNRQLMRSKGYSGKDRRVSHELDI